MINESEICTSYRNAKNKAVQIGILADLHATTPYRIRDILEENGFIVESVEVAATETVRTRKKWTPALVEEIAERMGRGATPDELAQQYQTTTAAIAGLQHRKKELFDSYASTLSVAAPDLPQPPSDANAIYQQAEAEASIELAPAELPIEPTPTVKKQRPISTVDGAKLNSVGLLLSHAKKLHQTAIDALGEGRNVECAYALGELSQVLIRAKEATTQF